MKNLVIIALTSMLLFSVSAGLSVWLKQSKDDATQAEAKKETDKEKDKEKKAAPKDDHGKPPEKEPTKPKADDHGTETKTVENSERDKVEKLKHQLEIVEHDLKQQREALNKLINEYRTETALVQKEAADAENRAKISEKEKQAAEKSAEQAKVPTDAKKVSTQAEVFDPASVEKLAMLIEKMDAEEAAKSLQAMADKGNLDAAVKVLNRMKDTKAAALITAIKDEDLRNQFLGKLLALRRPTGTK